MIHGVPAESVSHAMQMILERLNLIDQEPGGSGRRLQGFRGHQIAHGVIRGVPEAGHHGKPAECDGLREVIVIVGDEV